MMNVNDKPALFYYLNIMHQKPEGTKWERNKKHSQVRAILNYLSLH